MDNPKRDWGYSGYTPAQQETRLENLISAIPGIERTPSGIPGLDDLIEGGLPKGRIIGLTGSAGSGKTTMAFQFLHHGMTQCDEAGVYVTLEDEVSDLYQDLSRYGWDMKDAMQQNKLALVKSQIPIEVNTPLTVDTLLDKIHRAVTQVNAKRLVFDSLSALGFCYTETSNLRRDVLRLCSLLRELGCTTLLLSEMPDRGEATMRFGLAQFVTQGMMVLHMAHTYRAVEIRKMRGTRHDTNVHRMRFTDHGLIVTPGEHPI
jgi:KaiC/GvpD/RAD55 family RecA-like ATPase